MKKKGFTLVELISVLVIIGVLAVITVPLVVNNIESTRIKSYEVGVNNLFDALNKYITERGGLVDVPNQGMIIPENEIYKKLDLKNANYIQGKIIRNENGILEVMNISNGTYCASGKKNDLKVVKGNCDKLDAEPPTITITTGKISSNSITVVVNGNDDNSGIVAYKYYLNDKEMATTNTNTYTFSNLKPNTNYTVKVQVTDGNGNKTAIEKALVTQIATIEFKETPNGWSKAKTVTIYYPKKNEDEVYVYKLNNEAWITVHEQVATFLIDGKTTVTAQIIDRNGETVITNQAVYNNIDIVAPTITDISGNTDSWTTSKKIEVSAKDTESGIQQYSFDGGQTWQKENYKVFNKNQTLHIVVQDNVGNTSNESIELTKIDSTIPGAFNITAKKTNSDYESGNWTNETVTLYANPNPSETLSGYTYQWYEVTRRGTSSTSDLTAIAGATGRTYTITQNINKTYVVKVMTGAQAGPRTSENSINVKIDKTSPGCNWSGESTSWTNSSRTISLTCSDSGGSGCLGSAASNSWPYTSGTHKTEWVSYTIKDVAGNSTACSKHANVYVDKEGPAKPTISLKLSSTSGSNYTSGSWTDQDVWHIVSSSDSGSGIAYYQYSHNGINWSNDINSLSGWGSSYTNGKNQLSYRINWSGQWNFYVRAVDNLGNVSSNSNGFTVRIDKCDSTTYSDEYNSSSDDGDWSECSASCGGGTQSISTIEYGTRTYKSTTGSGFICRTESISRTGSRSQTCNEHPCKTAPTCEISKFTRYLAQAKCYNTSKVRYLRIWNASYVDFDIGGVVTMYGNDNNEVDIDSPWDAGNILGFCIEATSPDGGSATFCTTRQADDNSSAVDNCHYEYSAPSNCIDDCDNGGWCIDSASTPIACSATLVCD